MPEIKLQKRLPNLTPEEETVFTEAIAEAYQKGYENGIKHTDDVKRGHWIIRSNGKGDHATNWAECSECHTCGSPQWKVCPVCETKMDGDNDGNL